MQSQTRFLFLELGKLCFFKCLHKRAKFFFSEVQYENYKREKLNLAGSSKNS